MSTAASPRRQCDRAHHTGTHVADAQPSVGIKLTDSNIVKAAKLSSSPMDQKWRRYGQLRRETLLHEDSMKGGTSFVMNKSTGIDRYFQISQRVLAQFQNMFQVIREKRETTSSEMLDEAFIMGHRMLAFLSRCLPRHPQYHSSAAAEVRRWCAREMSRLTQNLEYLSILIDELELKKIVSETSLGSAGDAFQDPTMGILESEQSDSDDDDSHHELDFKVVSSDDDFRSPVATPQSSEKESTDVSLFSSPVPTRRLEFGETSQDWDPFGVQADGDQSCDSFSFDAFAPLKSSPPSSPSRERDQQRNKRSTSTPDSPTAKTATTCDSESIEEAYEISSDEEKLDCIGLARKFVLAEKSKSSFLSKVSTEDVSFETDSDAVDSWAQDESFSDDERPANRSKSFPALHQLDEPESFYISDTDSDDDEDDVPYFREDQEAKFSATVEAELEAQVEPKEEAPETSISSPVLSIPRSMCIDTSELPDVSPLSVRTPIGKPETLFNCDEKLFDNSSSPDNWVSFDQADSSRRIEFDTLWNAAK